MTGDAVNGRASTVAAKRELRRLLLAERRELPRDVIADASRAIVTRLRGLPELVPDVTTERTRERAGRRRVLLYAADPDEVDLDPLVLSPPASWEILLPRVTDGEIVAVTHRPGGSLAPGHRGIREPAGDPVDPSTIDLVVVPGVAFADDGSRLGRGAGMYDRLLPRLEGAARVGVCLERFIRPELPVEAHDASVDVVVTDTSVRRRTDAGGLGRA